MENHFNERSVPSWGVTSEKFEGLLSYHSTKSVLGDSTYSLYVQFNLQFDRLVPSSLDIIWIPLLPAGDASDPQPSHTPRL